MRAERVRAGPLAGVTVTRPADEIEPPAVLERARGELADILDNPERESPDR